MAEISRLPLTTRLRRPARGRTEATGPVVDNRRAVLGALRAVQLVDPLLPRRDVGVVVLLLLLHKLVRARLGVNRDERARQPRDLRLGSGGVDFLVHAHGAARQPADAHGLGQVGARPAVVARKRPLLRQALHLASRVRLGNGTGRLDLEPALDASCQRAAHLLVGHDLRGLHEEELVLVSGEDVHRVGFAEALHVAERLRVRLGRRAGQAHAGVRGGDKLP
mmetsp:Transcript_35486/g.60836  ORF Transcript_35486/g.60836 Transcript_35486/m.60836 type:complete len:222 (+) Transcript_35486:234-899(+)